MKWPAIEWKYVVAIAAIAGAVALIITNHDDGWGWLIFLAFAVI